MDGFEVYKLYVAIKSHFLTDKYDFFTFNGKTRTSANSFQKRGDIYFFKKLATKFNREEMIQYFVSHFVNDEHTWIGDISKVPNSSKVYLEWKRKINSMSNVFTNDIDSLLTDNNLEDIFKVVHTHPPLITKYLSKSITLETLVIMNKIFNYVPDLDKVISETVIWPDLKKRILKYQPFLSIDRPKYKQILLMKVTE
jgi:hypothetical protein